jgi:hypothetical protein
MTRRDSPDLRFDQAARPRLVGPPTASGVARMPFRCPESGLASLSRSRAPHANRLWPRPSRPRPGRRSAGRRPQLLSPGARVPVLSAAGGETVPSQRLDESAFTVSGPKAQRGTGSPDGGEQSEPGRSHGEPDSGTPSCAPPRTGRRCAACGSPATPRRKDRTSGEWVDKPNYFDITLWGALRPTAAPRSCRRGGASRSTAPRVARVGGAGRLAQAVGDLDRRRARSVPGDQGRRRARWSHHPGARRSSAEAVRDQQASVRRRFPDGQPCLLPRQRPNPDGSRSYCYATLVMRLRAWVRALDLRDEHGRLVAVTPHRFRHTVATRMIDSGVPQIAVQQLLDHESPRMTNIYARLHDRRCAPSSTATSSGSTSAARPSRSTPTDRSRTPPGPWRTWPAPSRRSRTATAACRSSSPALTPTPASPATTSSPRKSSCRSAATSSSAPSSS